MPFLESLHNWQNFFVVTGGAAAALIGLMFVAISLGSHLVTPEMMEGIRTYVNPTLIHFVVVFVLACTMLVPTHNSISLSIVIGLISVVGLWQTVQVIHRMGLQLSNEVDEDNHWLWHALLPLLSYTLGCAVAVGLASSAQSEWLNGTALMSIILTISAIHNTWILVLWIAKQH